ncbi:MAG TPA: NfeD family protein [Dermatophilaceae bacterium]|jgi:membrane protein implicated in regulation of membrane protease activity
MSWFSDNGWLAWVGLALILGAIEVVSVSFVFVMLAGGALAGALLAAVGAPFAGQVIAAVGVAAALLLMVRPVIQRHFLVPEGTGGIGAVAQVGRSALVLQTVTEHDGRVKLGGETWSARTAPNTAACLPGQEVRVVSIEGATAIVSSVADSLESE